jgi:predicted Zn-dependent peptidase
MEFKNKTLSNGLTIIGEPNKAAKSAAVGFFVRTGSRDETEHINGVSHFLEHMLFKGTETLTAFDVNEAFDKTGAQFNAFTSEESTVFYAAILPEYLTEVTELWSQLMRPSLRDDDFNLEKNVIKEEIAMYKDMPSFDVMDRCRTLHFDGHPCGNSVLGTEKSIDDMAADQMREYFNRRYAPNNIVVALAGNFDFEKISSNIDNSCGKWEKQTVGRELEDFAGSKKQERIEKSDMAREHICLMSHCPSAQDPLRFAASLLATIVGDDVGSRFFWELVDKAIAETASMQTGAMDGTGVFYTYIQCGRENSSIVLDIVKNIFKELRENGITEDELTKTKNKILSALVIKNELPMGRLIDLGMNWSYLKKYRTILDDINAVKAVTVKQVCSLIEQFDISSFTQFSIGPTDQQ